MSQNLPPDGALFLDHTGHFVADAAAATEALGALGFAVTPFSAQVQPDPATGQERLTGTGNICVMLPEGYLEFLVHTADTPLGLEFKAALDQRAGLHLLAFGARDTEARHAALQAAGHPMRPLVHFSREVDTETGAMTAAFTVARLQAGTMPEGRVQICTHHTEAAMWQPRWTAHPNGARRLQAMVISAPDPDETLARFSRFLGVAAKGRNLTLDRGGIEVMDETAATALTGRAVAPGRSAFVAVRVAVDDLDQIADFAQKAGVRTRRDHGCLVAGFAPALGPGAWLFEQA